MSGYLITCKWCGKITTVPNVIKNMNLCFSCVMDRIPYD